VASPWWSAGGQKPHRGGLQVVKSLTVVVYTFDAYDTFADIPNVR
jgi:hypothetical protein